MRWIVVFATLGSAAATAGAEAPDTSLAPFRTSDTEAATVDMHVTTDPCGELANVKTVEDEKVTCKRVATLRVDRRSAEVYQSTSSRGIENGASGVVVVIHDGKTLLASPIIAASYDYKLGADSSVIAMDARLRAIAGAAVMEVTTSNTWHERRTTPPQAVSWRARAFLACRVAGGAGTCSFAAFGSYEEQCSATLSARARIHYACTGVAGVRSEGDIAL